MAMSGPRPNHLGRRGAIYVARFRIPQSLVASIGMVELCRSLYTADATLARMPNPSRADLERSANQFFQALRDENDVPRKFHPERFDEELAVNIELSQDRIRELDDQLRENQFAGYVEGLADRLVAGLDVSLDDLSPRERTLALQLAARAERERQENFVHQLTSPAQPYIPRDQLFAQATPVQPMISAVAQQVIASMPLSEAGSAYLERKIAEGVGVSQRTELKRVLDWLQDHVGNDRQIDRISKAELRTFRACLGKVDVRKRGLKLPFSSRLTSKDENQIKSVTALRYWLSTQGFFAWAEDEGHIPDNPAAGLKLAIKRGQTKNSPEAFNKSELKKFCQTPLYSGYLSVDRVTTPGKCHFRGGRWWFGILIMFTGMRAAEVSQLLPTDFVFDSDFPHLKVQRFDANGNQVKSVKNASAVRDVPLAPELIILGLRQFVEKRRKLKPKDRLFVEFRPGLDRKSDGATKFWRNYLKTVGLWKEGRATHVWRHTLIATLRSNGVAEEDIQAVVGHARQTITAGYGGAYPLSRKAVTIGKLDFGFDVVAALGGPFDKKLHG
jgi:integrase